MKFAFIHTQIATSQDQRTGWTASALCRILRVSRSGYGAWQRRQHQAPTQVQQVKRQEEARLRLQIRAAYRTGRGYYGSPRVYDELRDQGIRTSRKRVARLMQQEGLVGRSRRRGRITTTDSCHTRPVADNVLARRFAPHEVAYPNRFWCGDITYLPTNEGWLYLATVKDVFSRRILGWAIRENLGVELVTAAWQGALHTRGLPVGQGPQLYHSDRGSQYASTIFQELLFRSGTQPSMSRKGECLDNAVAESFFGTLKAELLEDQPRRRFASKAAAIELIGDYIDNFYNTVRRHSALGSKSPLAFELAHHYNPEILLSQ
jgi:transposase InsO family protein